MARISRRTRLESGDTVRVVAPLFDDGHARTPPASPKALTLSVLPMERARLLNELWHSRLPLFGGQTRVCYGLEADGLWYSVALWSAPVARLLPQQEWLELRRLSIAPDAPKYTATRMLSLMAKAIRLRFPVVTTLVSYQDTEVHTGTIYKAANWKQEQSSEFRSRPWDNVNRHRAEGPASLIHKARWVYRLDG